MYSNLPLSAFTASKLYFVVFPEYEKTNFPSDHILTDPDHLSIIGRESDVQEQICFVAFKDRNHLPRLLVQIKEEAESKLKWGSHRCASDAKSAVMIALTEFCHNDLMLSPSCVDASKIRMDLYQISTDGLLKAQRNLTEYGVATHRSEFERYNPTLLSALYSVGAYCSKEVTMVAHAYGYNQRHLPIFTGAYDIEDIEALTSHPPHIECKMTIALT